MKIFKPNKAPKTNNMHFMFAPFLYVAAWRIPLTDINTRTVTWSAVIQLNKCSYRQQVSLLSLIQDMTHWTWLNPNAANIYILEQTNLNKGITIRWMHQDHSVKSHKTLQNSVIPVPVATFNFLPAAKTIIQESGNSVTCHLKNVHTRCKSHIRKAKQQTHFTGKKGFCFPKLTCWWYIQVYQTGRLCSTCKHFA